MSGEPSCEVCGGEGTYPIIDNKGSHRYDITCPECHGISDEEIERKCSEDRAVLEAFRSGK
jgi:DnaJ-class molecular chaperone